MSYIVKVTPRSQREALISNRVCASKTFGEKIYDFRSDSLTPPVISVPVELPVYRLENCRTFSAQQTEIAKKGLEGSFFDKGQELSTAQQTQHEILVKLSVKEKEGSVAQIMDVLRQEGQREHLLMTSTGVIVNGNRRLSAMRELLRRQDGSLDQRFANVLCDVLPPDVTRDEIDDIEADLQARPQTKLEYDWIGDARLVRRQVDKGRTTKEVAQRLRRSKRDIENVLQSLDEADLYLSEWQNRPGEYELVQDGQQIFGDIPKSIAKKDSNLQNASRAIAWSLYDNRENISGRVYRLNPAFGKLAPNVLNILEDQLQLSEEGVDSDDDDDDFAIDIDDDGESPKYSRIIEVLRDQATKTDAVEILIDACETVIELDKGQRNEHAALGTMTQISSKVMGVDIATAGETTLPAILNHIETIRGSLEKIEAAIKLRHNCSVLEQENEE